MTTLAIHIAFDGLSGVDGSARFSFGPTTALASISGPIAPRLASEHPVRASIDIHVRPLSSVSRTAEKHTANTLKIILERACILERHPRTSIQVVVQALSSSFSPSPSDLHLDADVRLAAEINAASLALLNAGSVPMRGVVCAIAIAATPSQSGPTAATQFQLVTDLSHDKANTRADHSGCFAFLFGVGHTHTSVHVEGTAIPIPPSKMIWTNYRARPGNAFSLTALAHAEKVALDGAAAVWTKIKESLAASAFAGDGLDQERPC